MALGGNHDIGLIQNKHFAGSQVKAPVLNSPIHNFAWCSYDNVLHDFLPTWNCKNPRTLSVTHTQKPQIIKHKSIKTLNYVICYKTFATYLCLYFRVLWLVCLVTNLEAWVQIPA